VAAAAAVSSWHQRRRSWPRVVGNQLIVFWRKSSNISSMAWRKRGINISMAASYQHKPYQRQPAAYAHHISNIARLSYHIVPRNINNSAHHV